jgi:hypothetical protein
MSKKKRKGQRKEVEKEDEEEKLGRKGDREAPQKRGERKTKRNKEKKKGPCSLKEKKKKDECLVIQQRTETNSRSVQSLRSIIHASPGPRRLWIVIRGTRRRHHASHPHNSSRPLPRGLSSVITARVHLVGIVEVDRATRFMSHGPRL